MLEIHKTKDQIQITNKVSPNWGVLIFLGLWLVGWTAMFLFVLYGIIFHQDRMEASPILFLIVLGLFTWAIFINNFGYKETLIVDSEKIVIITSAFFGSQASYERSLASGFSLFPDSKPPSWLRSWIRAGGNIGFYYMEMPKRFGKGLSTREADKIVMQLKNFTYQTRT